MSHDPSCIFCRIIEGQIPSARVLETDQAIAFLDISPVNRGHLLLLPRSHHPTLADLPDELSAHLGVLLPRLCRAVVEATACEAFNVIANNGDTAGQTVHHLHWHVIPRRRGDAVRWPWPHESYAPGEMEAIRARLAAVLLLQA